MRFDLIVYMVTVRSVQVNTKGLPNRRHNLSEVPSNSFELQTYSKEARSGDRLYAVGFLLRHTAPFLERVRTDCKYRISRYLQQN